MIYIEKSKNFEFYSSTSEGAVQGNGYELHKASLCSLFTDGHEKDLTNWCVQPGNTAPASSA